MLKDSILGKFVALQTRQVVLGVPLLSVTILVMNALNFIVQSLTRKSFALV